MFQQPRSSVDLLSGISMGGYSYENALTSLTDGPVMGHDISRY